MVSDRSIFITLSPLLSSSHSFVTLADGTSKVPIQGIGTIRVCINHSFVIEIHNVLFVPLLQHNLFSIRDHISYHNYSIHGANNRVTLGFPTFVCSTHISTSDIYLQYTSTTASPDFTILTCAKCPDPDLKPLALLADHPSKLSPHLSFDPLSLPPSPEFISTSLPTDTFPTPKTKMGSPNPTGNTSYKCVGHG